MPIQIVFETHSTSEDNEAGFATGWLPGRLSAAGRDQAAALGRRRQEDGIDVVFTSDLRRAVETTEVAFAGGPIPVFRDWRLRECDYGELNGAPAGRVHAERLRRVNAPYPGGGESWEMATRRVGSFLGDLQPRWIGRRILVVGHLATRWGLDRFVGGKDLADLVAEDFSWQEGWEYILR